MIKVSITCIFLFTFFLCAQPALAVEESLRQAAEHGNSNAQYQLGISLLRKSAGGNLAEAVKWLQSAATSGHADAQYSLALRYLFGQGVTKDLAQAADWMQKAAEQNHADAQYSLGMRYLSGQGRVKDRQQAENWFRKAAALGQKDAAKMLSKAKPGEQKTATEAPTSSFPQETQKLLDAYIKLVFAGDTAESTAEKKQLEALLTPKETLLAIQQANSKQQPNMDRASLDKELEEIAGSNSSAEHYFFTGNRLIQRGQLHLAILAYEKSLEQDPENPSGLRNLASAYAHTGHNKQAIATLQRSIELSPQQASKHATLGLIYHASGDLSRALQKYRDAASINPGLGWFLPDMAEAFMQQENYPQAWQALRQAELLGMSRDRITEHFQEIAPAEVKGMEEQPATSLHLRQLIFSSREDADNVLQLLQAGGEFNHLGLQRSAIDFQNNGGYWGPYLPGQLAPQIKAALEPLEPFAYSQVIESKVGFHILQKFLFHDGLLKTD